MNIIQLISIFIIIYILFLLFSNNLIEHFYKGKSSGKKSSGKKSKKSSGKKSKKSSGKKSNKSSGNKSSKTPKASNDPNNATNKESGGSSVEKNVYSVNSVVILKNIKTLKDTISETQKLIDLTNNTSINLNEIIKINNMRDSQIDDKIKNAIQKKNFTLFLIKKTQPKINQLNNLIILVNNIMSISTQIGKKQIDILNKKIQMQIFIINIYKNRTNSFICQTNNIFSHIEQINKNMNDINIDIKNKTSNYESLVLLTNKTVYNTNFSINDVNTQIIEGDKKITADAAALEEAANATADAGDAGDGAEAESPEADASEGDDVEEFVVESITLFDPIVYEKQNIIQNTKSISTTTTIIPVLNKDELVSPQFIEPNLNNLGGVVVPPISYMSPLPYTSLASMNDVPTSNEYMLEYLAELQLKPYLPIEENVPIPPNVNESDVLAENELIYELN